MQKYSNTCFVFYSTVRLADGEDDLEGRVELFAFDSWHTVCDDEWDINDAHVVCRALGYPGAAQVYTDSHFGGGDHPILLDDLECNGDEHTLMLCPSRTPPGTHNCQSNERAGVRCASGSKGDIFLTFCFLNFNFCTIHVLIDQADKVSICGNSDRESSAKVVIPFVSYCCF